MHDRIELVTIREIAPHDAKELSCVERCAAQAFAAVPELAWLAARTWPERCVPARIPVGECWLAAASPADDIVGFIVARSVERHLHIDEVSVRLDSQRQGIGTALLRRVLKAANELGATGTTLTTWRDVPWNAPWYRRMGFEVIAENDAPDFLKALLSEERAEGLSPPPRVAMIHPSEAR